MVKPFKIHPVIASDVRSDVPTEIPICSKLARCGKDYQAIPTPGGTLQDLRNFIVRFFRKAEVDSNRTIVFELDLNTEEYVGRTLDQLIDDYDFLTKYDKVVICCPLHYLASKAYREGETRIRKLIYRIEYDELKAYPKLQELYHSHLDYYKQERLRFYEDARSAARQWVEHTKKAFLHDTSPRTQTTLETDQTYDD